MFKNKSKTVFIIMVGSELHVFLLVLWKTKEIKKSIFSNTSNSIGNFEE